MKIKYIKGIAGWERDTHCEISNLEPGQYYVYVEVDWLEENIVEDTEFCVTCYSAAQTLFTRDEKNLHEKNDFLRKAFASKAT